MTDNQKKLKSEDSESLYKQVQMEGEDQARENVIQTRENILKSDARVDSKAKQDQKNKFDQKSHLQGDLYTNQNASMSSNFKKVAGYYDEVRNTVSEYGDSIKLFENELDQLRKFSEAKNDEISEMMPAEYEKFNMQVRSFFAKQQTQNFKMKKYSMQLTRDIGELRSTLMNAMDRVAALERNVLGEEQSFGMNNEEIERRSMAGSINSPTRRSSHSQYQMQ